MTDLRSERRIMIYDPKTKRAFPDAATAQAELKVLGASLDILRPAAIPETTFREKVVQDAHPTEVEKRVWEHQWRVVKKTDEEIASDIADEVDGAILGAAGSGLLWGLIVDLFALVDPKVPGGEAGARVVRARLIERLQKERGFSPGDGKLQPQRVARLAAQNE
jgi:hypothetical protein